MTERLTDEQLRAMTGVGWTTEPQTQAMADELLALRARVAKLEAALQCIYDITEDLGTERIARAALKDAPGSRSRTRTDDATADGERE